MKHPGICISLVCGAALVSASAAAQTSATQAERAPRPAAGPYDSNSAYADYRPYREERLRSWREVNEEVARIGGHAGVMGKAAQQAARPPEDAGSVAPGRAAPGHDRQRR